MNISHMQDGTPIYFSALYFYLGIYKQGLKIKVFTNKTKVIYILAKCYLKINITMPFQFGERNEKMT